MHGEALFAEVVGRRVDALRKDGAPEEVVAVSVDRFVVAAKGFAKLRFGNFHGLRHLFEVGRRPHGAPGEFRAEGRVFLRLRIGDDPEARVGLLENRFVERSEALLFVDEALSAGVHPDFRSGIVGDAPSDEGNELDVRHADRLRADFFGHCDAVARCAVERLSFRIGGRSETFVKSGIKAAPHHGVRREAARREHDRGSAKPKSLAPGTAGENARDASRFGEKRFGAGAVVNFDAEALGRGEKRLHVVVARPNGTRRDVAHGRGRNRPEGLEIPAHAELYEPNDGVVTLLREKPHEFGIGFGAARFQGVAHEALDVFVARSRFRIGKGDRDGPRRENGVAAQERRLFEKRHAARPRLKGRHRGGKSRRARAHDHDVGGEFPGFFGRLGGAQGKRRRQSEGEGGIKKASSLHRRTPIRMQAA